jgi:hypothetical protein
MEEIVVKDDENVNAGDAGDSSSADSVADAVADAVADVANVDWVTKQKMLKGNVRSCFFMA